MIAVTLLLIVAPLYLRWVLPASLEAAAYNRATGSQVSTWDALWLELRVEGQAQGANPG